MSGIGESPQQAKNANTCIVNEKDNFTTIASEIR